MDSQGVERYRIEGYLPKDWFHARLEMGLARIAFMHKKFADAEKLYGGIVDRYTNLALAAEAVYYRGVCKYKTTNDHVVLGEVAKELAENFSGNEWQVKSLPWGHE